jgi:ABC-type nickel/cobalt efflux system permease component RcnA
MTFANRVHVDRLGWREITLQGDGTTVDSGGAIPATSVSNRLTSYPASLLTRPFSQNEATFTISPGGPALRPPAIPDARPVAGLATASPAGASGGPSPSGIGAVPGGADIPSIFRTKDLSPAIVLLALGTAVALGAGHALTPGHGKTLMAAYLVGSRGTPAHAAGLGLSVTVAHTLGILALAGLVLAAQTALPPDVVVRWLPAIAALTIVAIGGWMILSEIQRRRSGTSVADHTHPVPPGTAPHTHDGTTHSHLPPGAAITWRSLFALGLAGGIIPSTSALLILLGTIAAGRTAFGVVLVVAFGLGMALVMSGVGLAMILARGRLDRLPTSSRLGGLSRQAPLIAGIIVLALGLWLTVQALMAPLPL